MRALLIAAALSLACSTAFATKPVSKPQPSNPTSVAIVAPVSAAQANASANAAALSGAVSGSVSGVVDNRITANTAAQTQRQDQLTLQGNTQSVNINEAPIPTKTEIKVRNTGDAVGYAAPPSAVCALTGGAGLAVPGFGASVSGSSIDKGCEARENARMLNEMGAERAALRVLCRHSEDVAREITICEDIVKLHEERARRSTAPASNFGIVN